MAHVIKHLQADSEHIASRCAQVARRNRFQPFTYAHIMQFADPATVQAQAERSTLSPLDQAFANQVNNPSRSLPSDLFDADELLMQPSTSMDPSVITHGVEGYAELDGYGASQAVAALMAMQKACRQIIDCRVAVSKDPTVTQAAKLLAVDALWSKVVPAATKLADEAHADLNDAIASMETELRAPVAVQSHGSLAAEVRVHLQSVPFEERMKTLQGAIDSGNVATVGAALGGPAYLAGLEPKMAKALAERCRRARNPLTVRGVELLRGARARLNVAGGLLISSLEGAIGAKQSTIARLRLQSQRAKTVAGAIAG